MRGLPGHHKDPGHTKETILGSQLGALEIAQVEELKHAGGSGQQLFPHRHAVA